MDVNDARVKANWLKSWMVLIALFIISGSINLVFWTGGREKTADIWLMMSCVFHLIWLIFCLLNAYDKPGTKQLTITLMLYILSIGRLFGDFNKQLIEKNTDIIQLIIPAITIPASIWFLISSFRLRRLNKQLQKINKSANKEAAG